MDWWPSYGLRRSSIWVRYLGQGPHLLDANGASGHVVRYVPFDLDGKTMEAGIARLVEDFPYLAVHGVIGDLEFHLSRVPLRSGRRLIVFFGSTIEDNYMVASGVLRPRRDHAQALAQMALEMNKYADSRPTSEHTPLQFRIGMNTGPVVADVIGYKKFHYDIWGDAVNTASHMESHGALGKIQSPGQLTI